MGVLKGGRVVVSEVGSGTDSGPGFGMFLLIYPSNPFDPSSCVILVFHCSKLSLLNFCSLDSIVSDDVPDIIVQDSSLVD